VHTLAVELGEREYVKSSPQKIITAASLVILSSIENALSAPGMHRRMFYFFTAVSSVEAGSNASWVSSLALWYCSLIYSRRFLL
jgi:hypothetical protein